MNPLHLVKREFLQSAMMWGVGEPTGELGRWWKEFHRPIEERGRGRWVNRFPLSVEMTVFCGGFHHEEMGFLGGGMVGTGNVYNPRTMRVRGGESRSVLRVVAGLGKSIAYAQGLLREGLSFGVHPRRGGLVEMGRCRGEHLNEIMAVKEMLGEIGVEVKPLEGWRFKIHEGVFANPDRLFLTLTAMKLVVVGGARGMARGDDKLRNLFAWWKQRDDDARLAMWVMERKGVPGVGVWGWPGKIGEAKFFESRVWATPQRPMVEKGDEELMRRVLRGRVDAGEYSREQFHPIPEGWTWGARLADVPLMDVASGLVFRDSTRIQVFREKDKGASVYFPRRDQGKMREIRGILGVEVDTLPERYWNVGDKWIREKGNARRLQRAMLLCDGVKRIGEKVEGETSKPKKPSHPSSKLLFQL